MSWFWKKKPVEQSWQRFNFLDHPIGQRVLLPGFPDFAATVQEWCKSGEYCRLSCDGGGEVWRDTECAVLAMLEPRP